MLRPDEIEATVAVLLTITTPRTMAGSMRSSTRPVERFKALDEEDRLGFKDALDKFVRTYSFLSQVVAFGDSKLERDYIYCRALASRLRDQNTSTSLGPGFRSRADPSPQRGDLRGFACRSMPRRAR